MIKQLVPSLRAIVVFTIFTGLVYPLLITGLAHVAFKTQADGSLLYGDKTLKVSKLGVTERVSGPVPTREVIGSVLIGQNFDAPQYFHPRPSAAGDKGYDANNSGGSNLGPTNKKLIDGVKSNLDKVIKENPGIQAGEVPIDAVTASASGLDPHISPEYALLQASRVAKARNLNESIVKELVARFTEGRQLGFLGEPRVNVLLLNLALDQQKR